MPTKTIVGFILTYTILIQNCDRFRWPESYKTNPETLRNKISFLSQRPFILLDPSMIYIY